MPVTQGFNQDPAPSIETVFRQIHQARMAKLPFCHPEVTVKTAPFQRQDGCWVGTLLTPWMLSLLILPASGNGWQPRQVGSKVGLSLGPGDFTFTVGDHPALGQYLACSLQSPLTGVDTMAQGEQLLQDINRLAWALPVQSEPIDPSKRQLFRTMTAHSPAEL